MLVGRDCSRSRCAAGGPLVVVQFPDTGIVQLLGAVQLPVQQLEQQLERRRQQQ